MFAQYLRAALQHAEYETIEGDGAIFATIPGFDGLWATAPTVVAAREELESVLGAGYCSASPTIVPFPLWME